MSQGEYTTQNLPEIEDESPPTTVAVGENVTVGDNNKTELHPEVQEWILLREFVSNNIPLKGSQPDIEIVELSELEREELFFTPEVELTKTVVEKRRKNIEDSKVEIVKLDLPSAENNLLMKQENIVSQFREEYSKREEPKTFSEKVSAWYIRKSMIRNLEAHIKQHTQDPNSKQKAEVIEEMIRNKYPELIHFGFSGLKTIALVYSHLATSLENEESIDPEEKALRLCSRLLPFRQEGDLDGIDKLSIGKSSKFNPQRNDITEGQLLRIARATEDEWNTLTEILKRIPHLDVSKMRLSTIVEILDAGIDEEVMEYIDTLSKDGFLAEKDSYLPPREKIILDILDRKKDLAGIKQDQNRLKAHYYYGRSSKYWHFSDKEVDENYICRLNMLRYGLDIASMRGGKIKVYNKFVSKDLQEYPELLDEEKSKRAQIIDQKFKIIAELEQVKEADERVIEQILNFIQQEENRELIERVSFYQEKLSLEDRYFSDILSEEFVVLSQASKKLIEGNLFSFEESLVKICKQIDSGVFFEDVEGLRQIIQERDMEAIARIGAMNLLYDWLPYSYEVSKELFDELVIFEGNEYFISEKTLEIFCSSSPAVDIQELLGESPYVSHRNLKAIIIEKFRDPDAREFWSFISKMQGGIGPALKIFVLLEEENYDYKVFLEKYTVELKGNNLTQGKRLLKPEILFKWFEVKYNMVDSDRFSSLTAIEVLELFDLNPLDRKVWIKYIELGIVAPSLAGDSLINFYISKKGEFTDDDFQRFVKLTNMIVLPHDLTYDDYKNLLIPERIDELKNPEVRKSAEEFWSLVSWGQNSAILRRGIYTLFKEENYSYETFLKKYTDVLEETDALASKRLLNQEFVAWLVSKNYQNIRDDTYANHGALLFEPVMMNRAGYELFNFDPSSRKFWGKYVDLEEPIIRDFFVNFYMDKKAVLTDSDVDTFLDLIDMLTSSITSCTELSVYKISSLITPETINMFKNPEVRKSAEEFWSLMNNLAGSSKFIEGAIWLLLYKCDGYASFLEKYTVELADIDTLNFGKLLEYEAFVEILEFSSFPVGVNYINSLKFFNLNPEQKDLWTKYFELTDEEIRNSFVTVYKNKTEDMTVEDLIHLIELLDKIENSPSKEIVRLKTQIVQQLFSNQKDDWKAKIEGYEMIENLFVRNNSPISVIRYKVFDTLFAEDLLNLTGDLNKTSNFFSTTLQDRTLDVSERRERVMRLIRKDLLKVARDSVDENFYNFLVQLRDGIAAIDFYDKHIQEGFTDEEIIEILGEEGREFLMKSLDIFFTTSNFLSKSEEISSRIKELREFLSVHKSEQISDGIYSFYLEPLGIPQKPDLSESIDLLLKQMEDQKSKAHQRGLQHYENQLSVGIGDLIKGVWAKDLGLILESGVLARDFLGASASQDGTPYDTDTQMVTSISSEDPLVGTLDSNAARGYGDMFLVFKDRGQFVNPKEEAWDSDKYELIYSRGISDKHYGIRTGIASTEIDFLYFPYPSPQELNRIKFHIAKMGVYIPILDSKGNILFTPSEFYEALETFKGTNGPKGLRFRVEISGGNPLIESSIEEAIADMKESQEKHTKLNNRIKSEIEKYLIEQGVPLETSRSGLEGARVENTGSTSRLTHVAEVSDFDFAVLVDRLQLRYLKAVGIDQFFKELTSRIGEIVSPGVVLETGDGGVQLVECKIKIRETGEKVDFDLAITDKKDNLDKSNTHNKISERLNNIRRDEGQEAYEYVLANIIFAKKYLKKHGCYKKRPKEGGLGGVGVENWILQHGGSFEKAALAFLNASTTAEGEPKSLGEFNKEYTVWDPGRNIRTNDHDEFVYNNMDATGYLKMREALLELFPQFSRKV